MDAITPVDAHKNMVNDDVCLIDVRSHDEFSQCHAEGAVSIPLETVSESLPHLASYKSVYVICHSGNRSAYATEFLQSQGIPAINITGGMLAWTDAGLPLVATEKSE